MQLFVKLRDYREIYTMLRNGLVVSCREQYRKVRANHIELLLECIPHCYCNYFNSPTKNYFLILQFRYASAYCAD